jgi:hypothetical protein
MAGDLPEGALERFTRKVQPVLVNNCTTSACHQPGGAQTFQLDRALLRGEANRRTTMQNLKAALALVDRNQPERSPLLTIPRQAHGGMAGPIFGPRHAQAYKHLADWVALLVPPPPAAPTSIDEPANAEEKITAEVPAENGNAVPAIAPVRPANQTEAIPHKPNRRPLPVRRAAVNDDEQLSTLRPPHQLRYGARLESWQPRDPFDPEIFNRMQRARTQTASARTPATGPDNR